MNNQDICETSSETSYDSAIFTFKYSKTHMKDGGGGALHPINLTMSIRYGNIDI
tara:strand:+ start:79 stop:240 length:162 start_codon:yes stop_codon:yes gene_type:complete